MIFVTAFVSDGDALPSLANPPPSAHPLLANLPSLLYRVNK